MDDQYYVGGSGLLVKPVTAPSVESTQVYLSDNQVSRQRRVRNSANPRLAILQLLYSSPLPGLDFRPTRDGPLAARNLPVAHPGRQHPPAPNSRKTGIDAHVARPIHARRRAWT